MHMLLLIIATLFSACYSQQIWTFFRRDYFLNDTIYPEGLDDPNVGGRWSMIFTAKQQNSAFPEYKQPFTLHFANRVTITLTPETKLPDTLDWVYAYYQQRTGQVWIALHHNSDDFFDNLQSLTITDANKQTMGSFKEINAPHCGLQLLYVTLDETELNQRLIVHWHDYYTDAAYDIKEMYFNGQLLDTAIPVGPLQHTIKTYNLSDETPISPGDIWTINVILYDGLSFGFGGRFRNSQQKFNIISIPNDSECPYPDTNNNNYNQLNTDLDITSTYLSYNSSCNTSPNDIIKYYNDNWDRINDNLLTLNDDLSNTSSSLTNYDFVVSALTIYKGLHPVDIDAITVNTTLTVHDVWSLSLSRKIWYPQLMTIINTYTSHESGRYAGITDIVSVQLLFAGCKLLPFSGVNTFPIIAPYEYYENIRLNNMPYSTFGIIQAFDNDTYLNKAEITLSIGQALAAGLNGFIFLKTDLTQQTTNGDAWKAAQSLMENIKYLEENNLLIEMAPHGANIDITAKVESLWSALRTINTLIIVGINTNCNGYDLSQCKNDNIPHWTCETSTIDTVNITVPPDWQQMSNLQLSVMEIVNGKETKPEFNYNLMDNQTYLVFDKVALDADDTTKIFLVTY
eukprot:527612_1